MEKNQFVQTPIINKKKQLITAIVMFAVSFVLLMVSLIILLDMMSGSSKELSWVVFLITFGWMTYLPGLLANIVSTILLAFCRTTTIEKQQRIRKIFFACSIALNALYIVFFVIFMLLI